MSGLTPPNILSYLGQVVVPYITRTFPPTESFLDFNVPTIWVDTASESAYILVSKALGVADWVFIGGTPGNVIGLTSNSGGQVMPNAGNINIVGDGVTITGVGNPADSTITLSVIGGVATTYTANSGTASPSAGNLNILGGTGITTAGSGSTITVNLTTPVTVPLGGTGQTSFTQNGVILGNNTSALSETAAPTQGEVLTASGTTPVFSRTVTGTGNFTFQDSTAGDFGALVMHHADSTNPGSHALVASSVPGGGGNAYIGATISAARFFSYGIIASDSDAWQLQTAANSNFSSGTLVQRMSVGGVQTMPLQPAFQAVLSSSTTNVTGDGTTYQIPFNNAVFDQNSNFTTGSSALFTAPVTGKYLFSVTVSVSNLSSGHTDLLVQFVTTSQTDQVVRLNPFPVYDSLGTAFSASRVCAMSAGDTAYISVTVSNGTKTVTVVGGAGNPTCFSGALLC